MLPPGELAILDCTCELPFKWDLPYLVLPIWDTKGEPCWAFQPSICKVSQVIECYLTASGTYVQLPPCHRLKLESSGHLNNAEQAERSLFIVRMDMGAGEGHAAALLCSSAWTFGPSI